MLVHGGGAQITAMMERRGITSRWVDGRRFTDLPTLACARVALADVSDALVGELRALGREAQPFRTGELIECRRRGELGLVGEPIAIAREPLQAAWGADRVPLIAPIGRDGTSPRLLNVNADDVAAAVAIAPLLDPALQQTATTVAAATLLVGIALLLALVSFAERKPEAQAPGIRA